MARASRHCSRYQLTWIAEAASSESEKSGGLFTCTCRLALVLQRDRLLAGLHPLLYLALHQHAAGALAALNDCHRQSAFESML